MKRFMLVSLLSCMVAGQALGFRDYVRGVAHGVAPALAAATVGAGVGACIGAYSHGLESMLFGAAGGSTHHMVYFATLAALGTACVNAYMVDASGGDAALIVDKQGSREYKTGLDHSVRGSVGALIAGIGYVTLSGVYELSSNIYNYFTK